MRKRRLIIIVLTPVLILLIPLVAMQFTDEVYWTTSDFFIAGVLLLSTGLLCEFAIRNFKKTNYRVAICIFILIVVLLIWVELAVGIFGTPLSGN